MEVYPNYFEDELNKELLPRIPHDHASYSNYIISLTRLWCKKHDIMFNNLMASLFSAVLQGNIVVEQKNKEHILLIQASTSQAERAIATYTPDDFLYNLYNKYNVPISDYSEMEFILGHKNYILNKLSNIHTSK